MHLHFREFQHLCCRQKMLRINFIDCRFFAFGCVKPHCQFEIADVYSRTAKDRKCRNDVIKWCEPITAASLNKYGEVFCMAICCANQPLEDLNFANRQFDNVRRWRYSLRNAPVIAYSEQRSLLLKSNGCLDLA